MVRLGESSQSVERRLSRRRAALVLATMVLVLSTWPLMRFQMDHYLPEVDNDEVSCFLQVKTFLFHGFKGGYFFVNDQVPAASIHFDTHGPSCR